MTDDLLPIDDTPVLDRSTLEHWATCPRQAVLRRDINSASLIAASGNETHEALSSTVQAYIESGGGMSLTDLVDDVLKNLMDARPDVQPDVWQAASFAAWQFAKLLSGYNTLKVERFDGGKDNRSGQLAMDVTAGVRVTSEIDLLLLTDSPEVLEEIDYKTGHFRWTERDVKNAFQFQMHAALVFDRYPGVKLLRVRIFNTRTNNLTYAVEFDREDNPRYLARISSAAGLWWRHHKQPTDKVPAWPARDKCCDCDCITRCSAADGDLIELAKNPAKFLMELAFIETKADAIKKQLAAVVKATGQDIRAEDGTCFGYGKPKSDRKPTAALYVAGKASEE